MRKIFQKWLLLFVAAAAVVTFALSFALQTRQARQSAEEFLRVNLLDAKRRLLESSNLVAVVTKLDRDAMLAKARAASVLYQSDPGRFQDASGCRNVAAMLGAEEILVTDGDGVVIASQDGRVGVFPEDEGGASPWLKGLRDPDFELVREARTPDAEGTLLQYAAVARRDGKGMVRLGLKPARLRRAMKFADIQDFAANNRIGSRGMLIVTRKNRIVGGSDVSWLGKQPAEIGIPGGSLKREAPFFVTIDGRRYMGLNEQWQDYILTGLLPDSEMYLNRNASTLFLILSTLIIFGVVFVLVSELVQRVVIDGIQRINRSLARITGGDLEEKAEVRTNAEFASLSDGINRTVGALKQAVADAAARLDVELEFARAVQLAALPRPLPAAPEQCGFAIAALMDPAREISGDFYDFFMVAPGRVALLVADVSGKGIPAAMVMMTVKTSLKDLLLSGYGPAETLTQANRGFCAGNETGMFVTAFLAVLDAAEGKLTVAGAGHNPPLLARRGEAFAPVRSVRNLVLGAREDFVYQEEVWSLSPGDRLLLYTDGVTEAQNEAGELFGMERFLALTNRPEVSALPGEALLRRVRDELGVFAGKAQQTDDITMLALSFRGLGGGRGSRELNLAAKLENLPLVLDFVSRELAGAGCTERETRQIHLAVEEIFTNIAHYAYGGESGSAAVRCTLNPDPLEIVIQISDEGTPYNPLTRETPDVTLPAEEREIGGLGILMARRSMDGVQYEYKDNRNVLTLKKSLSRAR